jgi:CRP/FNR family cyclic AMP-dependent transcriptional regulator
VDKEARELAARLAGFDTFRNCSPDELRDLAAAGRVTNLPAGWPFVTQGEPADACYFLLEGTARVFFSREEVAQLGPGDVIGEMAFVTGGQRGATVTSSSKVSALRVENDALRAVLTKHPSLKDTLLAVYNSHTSSSAKTD